MQLTLVCVLLALFNSSQAASKVEIKSSRLACTHILFQITAMVDLLGVCVYWTMLHAGFVESMKDEFWQLTHMYLVHSFPTICLVIVYMTTERLVIKKSHCLLVAPLVPIYATINYFETMKRGVPLYWFLNWVEEFWTAFANLHILFAIFVMLWIAMAKLTQWGSTPHPSKKQH